MGAQIGYSDAYYGKIERPGSSIGANIVIAVCHVFNVRYDYLVYGKGPMFDIKDQQQKELDEKFAQMNEPRRAFLLRYADMLLDTKDDYIIEVKLPI